MKKTLIMIGSLLSTSAFAHHPGDGLSEMLSHLLEPDHFAMIVVTVIAGFYAIRRFRNTRVLVPVKKEKLP
jgi:hypothetical protein